MKATTDSDGSLLDGSAGGAAVRIEDGDECECILIPLGDGQVAEGEVEGLLKGTGAALDGDSMWTLMVSDSRAELSGIQSTTPRSGQFRAIGFDKLVRNAMERLPGLQITNLWTPAHIGTAGNELADAAAKAATLLPPPSNNPVSLTTCKRQINVHILERWDHFWMTAQSGNALRQIDSSPPSLILRSPYISSMPRFAISILAQLRTDFSALNASRFRCRLVSSPACDHCGASGKLGPTSSSTVLPGNISAHRFNWPLTVPESSVPSTFTPSSFIPSS
ncbi:hypothetical protein C8R43DRAFT_1118521 [Mycena crocata]|nr:hypothetical protein C8R43DRAFT_1118521 [Mycena crocata]